ncbi:hypothetical protein NP493_2261g00013 [Ridgeia piscesae]|uniref:Uncharacterized protein n=1 Tax=Ridgeia piscesae TaxID=27915 RepID=A0AAD9JIU5_RIDPI|nr:hypothetical protein NP493_2261g00013 [Ridgeia piscesae]
MVSADKWVYGLAVDPEKDKLYITDYGSKKIVVTSLDGSGERTLLNCTDLPRGLVVDRIKRLLFYSTYQYIIYKANLDGTDVTPIVSTSLTEIYGIDIDFSTDSVCWADYCKYHLINL